MAKKLNINFSLVAVILAASFLVACGKKSSSGTKTAATPGSSCTWNPQLGTYTDSQGRACSNYNGQNCQAQGLRFDAYTGKWYDLSNNVVACNDGGQWGQNGYFPYNGYYGNYGISGCEGWSQIYGVQYIPISVGYGQMVCANVQWVGGYYPQIYNYPTNYFNSYNPIYAWSQYDPYYSNYYGNYNTCSSSLNIGFSNWNMGVGGSFCFN